MDSSGESGPGSHQQQNLDSAVVSKSPKISRLQQLVMCDDDELTPDDSDSGSLKQNDSELLMNEEGHLPTTRLGQALDHLLVSWTQLMSNTTQHETQTPPTVDHVKEVAEVYTKGFNDACNELNSEFTRAALQWQFEHPDEALKMRAKDYSDGITRQTVLLGRVPGALERRAEEFFLNPN